MSYEQYPFKEIGTGSTVFSGFAFKSKDFSEEGIPVVKIKNVNNRVVELSEVQYFPETKVSDKHTKFFLEDKDVLIAMTGQGSVGRVGRISLSADEKVLLNQRVGKFVSDEKNINQDYLYYVLSSPMYEQILFDAGTGSGQPNLSPKLILQTEIPLPPYDVQVEIGKILSYLDEKIKLNQKMNQTLEKIGQAIFKHWFVHFEFPNKEGKPYKSSGGEMVDSELGEIPKGWELVSVADAVEINPKLKVNRDIEKIHVPMTGLSKNSMIITQFEVRTGSSGAKFQNYDTLFARITPSAEHGKTGFVQFLKTNDEVAIGSTEFIVMRSRTVNPFFVYCLARYEKLRKHAINSMTGTSGRQRVQNDCFNNFFIAQPDETTLFGFEKFMKPIFQKIEILNKENQNLSMMRDSLLPKLMSGKIRVK